MKTYLIIWHNSEGANPYEVMQALTSIGFKPVKGHYDLAYDHGNNIDVSDIMELAIKVHETLKGMNVLYKLETPES